MLNLTGEVIIFSISLDKLLAKMSISVEIKARVNSQMLNKMLTFDKVQQPAPKFHIYLSITQRGM